MSRQCGFTLIELMIVVAVIGVLVAIAIPQFNEYRARSNDALAQADVRNSIQVFAVELER
ncbi:pilin [Ectopseudomonas mendocina]|nr:prepilin-type N-terminal cleavage/methylation domain-containing protein [Pseudomonas mendocina]TRO24084.1 pilin [Pseudomonas mendocina]TRO25522.1 pilin [Pseudomonas mendocina]